MWEFVFFLVKKIQIIYLSCFKPRKEEDPFFRENYSTTSSSLFFFRYGENSIPLLTSYVNFENRYLVRYFSFSLTSFSFRSETKYLILLRYISTSRIIVFLWSAGYTWFINMKILKEKKKKGKEGEKINI